MYIDQEDWITIHGHISNAFRGVNPYIVKDASQNYEVDIQLLTIHPCPVCSRGSSRIGSVTVRYADHFQSSLDSGNSKHRSFIEARSFRLPSSPRTGSSRSILALSHSCGYQRQHSESRCVLSHPNEFVVKEALKTEISANLADRIIAISAVMRMFEDKSGHHNLNHVYNPPRSTTQA